MGGLMGMLQPWESVLLPNQPLFFHSELLDFQPETAAEINF
jgi:hypothetical protein